RPTLVTLLRSSAPGRARWGASGSLNPQSAIAGPTTARGAESSGPGLAHVALTARFRALGACEPRQIREEAALSRTSQVPRARLARAGDGSAARGVRFEGGARDRALGSPFLEGKEPGMERSDELVGLMQGLYEAMRSGDVSGFESAAVDDVLVIGTDPQGWWSGRETVLAAFRAETEAMGGGFPVQAGEGVACSRCDA